VPWGAAERLPTRRAADAALAFGAYATLTLAAFWPLAAAPARMGFPNPDAYGNTWALAWVVHQVRADPRHLYDANIYHPHEKSFTYTESLLPQALQAAPVLLAGGSPLLAHNLVLLLSFPLSGLGAYLLARELSGSRAGAFIAGLGFTFCAYRFDHLIHVQSLSIQWLPLAVLYLLKAARTGRPAHLLALSAFAVLQALSSGYYAVLLVPALGIPLLQAWLDPARRRHAVRAAAALSCAAVLTFLVLLPDTTAHRRHGLHRSRAETVHWSARWRSYLEPGRYAAWPHLRALHARVHDAEPLYPGLVILALAIPGLPQARRSEPARLAAMLTAAGLLLSLGPEASVGPWVVPGPYEVVRLLPGASALRTPSRLGILAVLGLDLLAAIGWARLSHRLGRPRLMAAAVAFVGAVELWPAGLAGSIREVPPTPATARWLAAAPRGPVLELPWSEEGDGALYAYWSTVHWQPMVNGWGAFAPHGNFGLGVVGARWPTPYTARLFRNAGIRYVVVHTDRVTDGQRRRIADSPLPYAVRLAADLGPDRIYVIDPE
jgi:hypothetical protein